MSEYNNFYGYDLNAVEQTRETNTTLAFSSVVNKVYIWMTMALVLTGLTAYYVAGNESLLYSIIGSRAVPRGWYHVWALLYTEWCHFVGHSIGLHHGERGYHLLCYGWHVWCNVIGRSFH